MAAPLSIKSKIRFTAVDFWVLLGLLIFSLFFRTNNLSFPDWQYFDEFHYVPGALSYFKSGDMDRNHMHPPLGKIIIGSFIQVFGNHPAGWRSANVAFGLLLIGVVYFFALTFFRSRLAAILSAIFLSLDFLHLVQSRITSLDIFLTGFVFLAYYFAYLQAKGVSSDPDGGLKIQGQRYLFLTAVCLGLAIAVKLSGISAFLGVWLFLVLLYWKKGRSFQWRQALNIALIFMVLGGLIFFLAHIPLFLKGEPLQRMFYAQNINLHYQMEFNHQYLSQMWEWPTVHRPVWYIRNRDLNYPIFRGVAAIGNLFFWWAFIPAFLYLIYRAFKKLTLKYLFILCGYLPLYLFWFSSVSFYKGFHFKGGFFYYMLPCLPFMVLTIVWVCLLIQKHRYFPYIIGAYLLILVGTLLVFYPVLAGLPVDASYIKWILRFSPFSTWI